MINAAAHIFIQVHLSRKAPALLSPLSHDQMFHVSWCSRHLEKGKVMSEVLTPFLWNKFISCNRRHHRLQTLFLVFNFTTSETNKSFVTRTNALLVDTFISIDDVSMSIAVEEGCFNCGRYKNRELHRLSLLMLFG